MADTEHEVDIKHNLDEYAQKIKETNDLWDAHFAKVKAVNDELTKLLGRKLSGAAPSLASFSGGSSQDRNIEREYYRAIIPYAKAATPAFKSMYSTTNAIGGGLFSMASGGGLQGFARGLSDLGRQMRSSGGFAQSILSGAAVGATSGRKAASGAAAAATEGVESAIARGAEQGIGFGLIQAFGKLPAIIKLGAGALLAAGGLDVYAMDKATKDVYGRSRRAAGYGANIGQLSAFDATMGRYVDTDSMMTAMGQAKYDFTSSAALAAKISGINPKDWSDPAAMAEGTILSVQRQLKSYSPDRMLSMAHTRGFQDLGLSDQDLIRLYTGSQKDVNDLVKKAQGAAPGLDQSKDIQKKYQDFATDIDLTGMRLRVMGENILSYQMPTFMKFANVIDDFTEKYGPGADSKPGAPIVLPPGHVPVPYKDLGPSFWNGDFGSTPGGKYAFPGAGFGPGRSPSGAAPKGSANDPIFVKPADLPALDAGAMSFDVPGGGGFAIPGGGSWGGQSGPHGRRSSGGGNYDQTGPDSAGAKPVGAIKDRAMALMGYLVKERHWTPVAAAIAAGNAEQESGINPAGPMGDPGTVGYGERGSWGMFQWNRKRLHDLKAKYGDKWRTNEAQFPYFADEAERMVPGWKDVKDFSYAGGISHDYEGYGDNSTGTRIGNARKWLRTFQNQQGDHSSPAVSTTREHTSMNDMSIYQQSRGVHVRVSNPAGANVNVQTAMLGAVKGSFS